MKRKLILSALVVFLLVGGLFLLRSLPEPVDEPTEEPAFTLEYLTDREEPLSVTLIQGDQTQTYTRFLTDGSYGVEDYPTTLKFDQVLLGRLFSSCAKLPSKKTVEQGVKDFDVYGLSQPTVYVEAKFENGDVLQVEVGDRSPLEDGYYGRISGSRDVLLLSTYDVESFERGLYDFREKRLLHDLGEDAEEYALTVQHLRFERHDAGTLDLKRRQVDGVKVSDLDSVPPIELTEPVICEGDEYAFVTRLVQKLFQFRNASPILVQDSPDDLSVYGLDEPERLYLQDETGEIVLLIGRREEDSVYVMQEGTPCVFLIKAGMLDFFYIDYTDVMSKIFWIHNIEQVKELVVVQQGERHTLQTEHAVPRFVFDGREVPEEPARKLFLSAISLMVAGKVESEPECSPVIEMAIAYHDGSSYTLELFPMNERYYSVHINGLATGFYCNKKDVDALESALNVLVQS